MNSTIWKQADSRWGSLPYPEGCTFAGCGCGSVSCTHIAMEQKKYASWDPKPLRKYMVDKGYAVKGKGTLYKGITETLEYLGHKVVLIDETDPMTKAWAELNKGNRIGILCLAAGKGPDGTEWTTTGHYVAFTGYKYENKQHWFYIKDSSWRNHDGWFAYEKSIKGLLPRLWIVERLPEEEPDFYKGEFPSVSKKKISTDAGKKLGETANKLAYPDNTKDAKYPSGKPTKAFETAFKKVYKGFHFWNAWAKKGASCDVFIGTCRRYSGLFPKSEAGLWKLMNQMKKDMLAVKGVTPKNIRTGDIILYRKTKAGKHGHVCMHYEGKIKEASAGHYYAKTTDTLKDRLDTKGKRYVLVFRAKGKTITVDQSLKKGSKGDEVKKWQRFLNWYIGKKVLGIDGDFGSVTEKYTKIFQTENGLVSDGVVGVKTVAKAKEVKR